MSRQWQSLRPFAWPQQRKLFLLVFIWTCICLVLFRSLFFGPSALGADEAAAVAPRDQLDVRYDAAAAPDDLEAGDHFAAKRAASSLRPPEPNEVPQPGRRQRLGGQQINVIDSTSENKWEPKQPRRQQQQEGASEQTISSTFTAGSAAALPPTTAPVAGLHEEEQARAWQRNSAPEQRLTSKQHQQQQQPPSASSSSSSSRATAAASTATAAAPVPGSECQFESPSPVDLQFNNIYWQKLTTRHAPPPTGPRAATGAANAQASYYLYNAYYDDRWRGGLPSVRLLAMIDRVQPPATNCLLWSSKLRRADESGKLRPIITRAHFVYAWYPKWGNYEDGLLQPWIVTCQVPREHAGLVPDSVSLIEAPLELRPTSEAATGAASSPAMMEEEAGSSASASIMMPPAYSSSSSSPAQDQRPAELAAPAAMGAAQSVRFDCQSSLPITNNLPVQNKRPPGGKPEKFAVCVKGLDFPHDDVSIRLVEWIEMLNLLGAKKIFLYELDVHKNISKVLDYYQARGLVELNKLTLPGEQPNLPEYQHQYLKQKLTSKRQNELVPYNDCLYRNLYSYQYLALLDIDEIIMPLRANQSNWYELMEEVERLALAEQNYSRASYNVRNVYFFDDLSGPLGTTQGPRPRAEGVSPGALAEEGTAGAGSGRSLDGLLDEADEGENENENENELPESDETATSLRPLATGARARGQHESAERGIPHYLHMMSHVYRSKNYTEPGQYVKCFHNTERVVSLHNHFPMNCFGQCTTYSIPVHLAHLQHYRKDCVGPLRQSCKNDFRHFTTRDTTIWKYKQRMIKRTTRALSRLGLLSPARPPT